MPDKSDRPERSDGSDKSGKLDKSDLTSSLPAGVTNLNIKRKQYMKTKFFAAIAATFVAWGAYAAEPAGYYSSCDGKNGAALLSALSQKIGNPSVTSYDGLWALFTKSDVKPNGRLWDMYSTKEWTTGQKCGNYSNVGDCYNREHSFPKSWFDDARPMYSDAYHLYPTDGKVNGQRSNFPFGECANGTSLGTYNGVRALGKLGTSTFPGYSGKVFEPDDQYKGDFARSYFYMAAAYNTKIASWNSDMLAHNSYPAFADWAVNLLLKWHRQDPVSQKELDRNEVVAAQQKNRNPFIDHPELAEYIWGDKKTEPWSSSGVPAKPEFSIPANGSTIDMGTIALGATLSRQIKVKGEGLTAAATVTVSGAGFSVTPASLSAASVNQATGTELTVSFKGSADGVATGKLTITSGEAVTGVTLTARTVSALEAGQATDIGANQFTAHWTYIGDEDSNGNYIITVYDASNAVVDTYPRSVKATDGRAVCDELDANTPYTYTVSSKTMTSKPVAFTTGELIPSVLFMYDGELAMTAVAGTPSEAYEILLDIENIAEDINISVTAPFQVTTDKAEWGTSVTVSPVEDRIYLRVNSETAGQFSTVLKAVAGDYINDETEVSATVTADLPFMETFEANVAGSYLSNTEYQGSACKWMLVKNAGVYAAANEAYEGSNYLRFGKNTDSSVEMADAKEGGVSTVEFMARKWPNDADATLKVEYSVDGGEWAQAGSDISLTDGKTYNKFTVTVNQPGAVRIRIAQTAGGRLCIDNVALGSYAAGIEGVESDYRGWTAYSHGGQLVVELSEDAVAGVYGVDGKTYHHGLLKAGNNVLDVPAGLYVVAVKDFSRRVLVK